MKTLRLFLVTVIAASALSVTAQTKNEIIKVWGNCETCKARIEKAAKSAGATIASWDIKSQVLSVSFNSATTSLKSIEEKVASSGHDTKDFTAKIEAYKSLPGCCQYERKDGAVASVKSCCTQGASCCGAGQACCAQTSTASSSVKADCCADGGSCCGSGQACCTKVAKASTVDCCTPGASCCGTGQACCSKVAKASSTDCCTPGASCCGAGQACCSKAS